MTEGKRKTNLRVGDKGRVTLGSLAEGVSSFDAVPQTNGNIILVPNIEIPKRELWIHRNKNARKAVQQGLKEIREGKIEEVPELDAWLEEDD
jgi:hypothetical protein